MTDKTKEPVVFRKWRPDHGSGVIALLPGRNYNTGDTTAPGRVMAFEHIGQHGEADIQVVLRRTRPAEPDEYADVLRELEQRYGYHLRPMRRIRQRV